MQPRMGTQPKGALHPWNWLGSPALTTTDQAATVTATTLLGAVLPGTSLQNSGVYEEGFTFSTTKTWREKTHNQKEHMKATGTYANANVLFLLREKIKSSPRFSRVNVSRFCFKMIVKGYLHLTEAC